MNDVDRKLWHVFLQSLAPTHSALIVFYPRLNLWASVLLVQPSVHEVSRDRVAATPPSALHWKGPVVDSPELYYVNLL